LRSRICNTAFVGRRSAEPLYAVLRATGPTGDAAIALRTRLCTIGTMAVRHKRRTADSRKHMATPITINIPHDLGRAEARRRIEAGFTRVIHQLPGSSGASQMWDGDRLSFSVRAMGQTVAGVVDVFDATVAMEIHLPGLLGMIASGLKGRLQKAGQLLLTKK
jgi:hypothetical protein